MSDSTRYLDELGIRRPEPVLRHRFLVTEGALAAIGSVTEVGAPDSALRQGWVSLLQVHGEDQVLRCLRRCQRQGIRPGRITSDQVMAVLDRSYDLQMDRAAVRRSRACPSACVAPPVPRA